MSSGARYLRCPEDVLGWIPWYVDGSLNARQRGLVEAHASQCADCRAELDMVSGAPFEIDVELPDPDQAFSQIMSRIEASADAPKADVLPIGGTSATNSSDDGPRSEHADDWARIEQWAIFSKDESVAEPESGVEESDIKPRGVLIRGPWLSSTSWAAAAAVVLVSVGALAGVAWQGRSDRTQAAGEYQLAAAEEAHRGAMIDVVFREAATAKEIATALRSIGGEVVSGPTNLGVYRVLLSSESADSAGGRGPSSLDLDVARARLMAEADGVAIFAEAVP